MKRFLVNFLIFNLAVAAVGWVMTDRCLHFLSISVDAKSPVTIKPSTEFGTFGFAGKGLETLTAVQPTDANEISLTFVGPRAEAKVVEVRYSEHVVLNRCWSGDALQTDENGGIVLDPARAHWGVCPFFFTAVGALEIALLLLVILVAWLTRKDVPNRGADSLVAAFVLAVFICLVVPLQTYLGNADCFSFTCWELALDLLPRMAAVAAIMFALLWIGGMFAGRFWLALVVAVAAYEYLETGILSIGNPPLDGDAIVYKGLVRGAWDAAVFVIIVVVLFLVRNTKAPFWTALAVLLLSVCSLFDSRKERVPSFHSDLIDHPTPNSEVIKSTIFSANKNVMLIFLDCISTTHVQDVLSQSEELRNAFDGFTFCTNNVGMYHDTANSIPAIMTGRYHGINDLGLDANVFSSGSILDTYIKKGAEITFQFGLAHYGYTTQKGSSDVVYLELPNEAPLYRRMVDQQQWNVFEIVKFRLSPYMLKYYVYSLEVYGWGEPINCYDESAVFPSVARAPMDESSSLAFLSFHTIGAHPPYQKNRYGTIDPTILYGYRGKVEATWYALSQVAQALNALKKREFYDKTSIVILSDHGGEPLHPENGQQFSQEEPPARSAPFLLYKPTCSRGELRMVGRPTSHAKVFTLLKRLASCDLDADEMLDTLTSKNRTFIQAKGSAWYEYRFKEDCHVFAKRRIDDFALAQIELGREYSFEGGANGPPVETMIEGEQGMLHAGVRLMHAPVVKTVATGRPNADFEVELGFWLGVSKETGSTERCFFRLADLNSENKVEAFTGKGLRESKKLTLKARSDDKGLIRLSIACTGDYGLRTLKVF